jgi:hypothetical protein
MPTPRKMQAGVPQGSAISLTLFNMHINDASQICGVHLSRFANDTGRYAIDQKGVSVIRKLQRGLSSMETWCENWTIRIIFDKTHGI